ncbi:MAG: sigma-70 family RNA polymerase sigma factor [Lentisphaeraceae bacterium]|nr:sigma-70 family RNA polymerase sigma factor [Lentisphaeraceae bacterium]
MDDRELIIAARGGNLDAFSKLVQRYQGNVRACLAVRLDSRHETEDLAQEAFIVAYRKLNEFDDEKAFGPWIRSIAFYLLRNYWRKHKATPVGGAAELEILIDEEIGLRYSEKNECDSLVALKSCKEKLDEDMKHIVDMHYHKKIPLGEITKMLNVKHSTMTMRLHRMRDQLRKCITQTVGNL